MLDEPAGLRPRLRENSPSLPAGSPLPGCSAVVSFGHWVLDSDRGRRKSCKPGPLTLQCSVGQADLAVGGDVRPFVLPLPDAVDPSDVA
jgi:hypothetical protein